MSILMSAPRIDGLNVENALALAARLRERADGLPQDLQRFLATPWLAQRLRVMASYLTWLAGAEA